MYMYDKHKSNKKASIICVFFEIFYNLLLSKNMLKKGGILL